MVNIIKDQVWSTQNMRSHSTHTYTHAHHTQNPPFHSHHAPVNALHHSLLNYPFNHTHSHHAPVNALHHTGLIASLHNTSCLTDNDQLLL